eukprot:CAMPEP_0178485432 /NCGR_PEP_ID=MMETSP0696-20121128/8271_1 /TAXON_ID=265572 /ORGANISM="Extubocellulus spinifer, Strain CCMP396" /LENGTH=107 /DNA_ID=CAMNT_0020113029 /DNA_START=743 /DNA_END=1062 /DNA_ORIENTATION=-
MAREYILVPQGVTAAAAMINVFSYRRRAIKGSYQSLPPATAQLPRRHFRFRVRLVVGDGTEVLVLLESTAKHMNMTSDAAILAFPLVFACLQIALTNRPTLRGKPSL